MVGLLTPDSLPILLIRVSKTHESSRNQDLQAWAEFEPMLQVHQHGQVHWPGSKMGSTSPKPSKLGYIYILFLWWL